MGVRRWQRAVLVAIVGALASTTAALGVGGASSGAEQRAKGDSVEVELDSPSQRQILVSNRLTVNVTSDVAGKARVRGHVQGAGGKPAKVAKRRQARLKAGEPVAVKLPLTAAGRTRLASCQPQEILIRARATVAGDRLGDRDDARVSLSVDLVRDTAACAAPSTPGGGDTGAGGGAGGGDPVGGSPTARCDPLDPSNCLYPWPNDLFTEESATSNTGRQVALDPLAMPTSRQGVPILPEPFNRSDGFSPGNLIVTKVPGLDNQQAFDNTGAVPITNMSQYADPDQPVVVINADTGERHLIWSEIDANPADPADKTLIIRPGVNFEEGGHYIVALRNLKDASGNTIEAQQPFKVYRDNLPSTDPAVVERRPHMEEIFTALANANQPILRDDLYLAWDFTVASEENLTERALHIRDDAFAELGDENLSDLQIEPGSSAPEFTVDNIELTPTDPNISRIVEGTFTVPCYLNAPGCPTGSRFTLPPGSNIPQRIPGNTMDANFTCIVPNDATTPVNPTASRPSLYGHGLLGSASEVTGGNVKAMAGEHNMTFCATDWAGFATQDAPNILLTLQDLNNFPSFIDRTQQGFLNFLYLGRLMIHPTQGFNSNPAFQAGLPLEGVLDTQRLFYDGNSQGGILGGALAALGPDHDRAVLGVPGMNYSTLLRRSSDFAPYAEGEFTGIVCDELPSPFKEICEMAPGDTPLGLYDNYPDELERPLILSLMQMQWDRSEANGYAHHMTDDPLADTPPHEVLLHVAFGDHQVSQWTAEVETRTIGASVHTPTFDNPSRHPDVDELFGIPAISYDANDQFDGSALVYWDSGPGVTPAPPITNVPPEAGQDPHGHPRNTVAARQQKSAFLQIGGLVEDVCDGPCHTDQYDPTP